MQLQSGIAAEPYGPPTPPRIGSDTVGVKSDRNVNVRARLGRFYINLLGPDIVRGLLGRPRLQSEFAGGDLLECKSPPANTNRRGAARVGNSQVHSGLAGVQVRSGLARLPTARSVLLVCGGLVLLVCGGLDFARVWGRLGCNSRLQMHSASPPPNGSRGETPRTPPSAALGFPLRSAYQGKPLGGQTAECICNLELQPSHSDPQSSLGQRACRVQLQNLGCNCRISACNCRISAAIA